MKSTGTEDASTACVSKPKSGSTVRKITRSETFGGLLKTRPVAKTERLMLHALLGTTPSQFGILVPKRLAKRAVDRNTLKRLIRHACQESLSSHEGKFLVRLNKPVKAIGHSDRAAWWTELQQLFSDLSRHASSRR